MSGIFMPYGIGNGREIELQVNATHIQWRYVGDLAWTDLAPLTAITGQDGADGNSLFYATQFV